MGNAVLAYAGGGGGSFFCPATFGYVATASPGTGAPYWGGGATGGGNGASQGVRLGGGGGIGVIILTEYF
jgi:hypothetical protein